MALNYDISIHCIDENGDNIGDVKIHAYFKKENDSSSDTTWDGDIRKTSGNGKTSFNLGDGSFLGSDGKIDNGDIILITAWLTDNADTSIDDKTSKDNNTITRCVNFIHTINTDESSYTEEFTVINIQGPICDFDLPDVTHTGHEFIIDNKSYTEHGPYNINDRDDLYQDISKYSNDLFIGLEIKKTHYDLIEKEEDKDGIEDYNYTYIDSGDYDTKHTIYNFLGYYCFVEKTYHIKYNKPTVDFDYTFTKLLNSDEHIGVGDDDELKTSNDSHTNYGDTWEQINALFDWEILDKNLDDTNNHDIYNDKDIDFEPTKLYHSSSIFYEKNIKLTLKWNDGFDDFSEVKELQPYLDIYNIKLSYNWQTEKDYQVDDIDIPLGDDDKVKVYNTDSDDASQDYNSLTQWKSITWNITKKKNDGTEDNEEFNLDSDNDNIDDIIEYYVKYYHDSDDKANINQKLIYWDGFEDITKNLSIDFETIKYNINQSWYWETDFYGKNKHITRDDDSVTITSETSFGPQNNLDLVIKDKYEIDKDKYTSYTDDTLENDDESFEYDDLEGHPNFVVKKDGEFEVNNIVEYYDGYQNVSHNLNKILEANVSTPSPRFEWNCRRGVDKKIEGRDDLVTFSNHSILIDYYDTEKAESNTRNLSIDWTINNFISKGNFSDPSIIGGDVFTDDDDNIEVYLDKEMDDTIDVNYWTALSGDDKQNVNIVFKYNDGFFNREDTLDRKVETINYQDLVPDAIYTESVPDRHTTITFKDDSTINEGRIIDTDWSLTDRYQDNSMTNSKRGTDNLQEWDNVLRSDSTDTKVNSLETHTLSQDTIRWDNGFTLKTFNKDYSITTSSYSLEPDFSYTNIYKTGPEIRFTNETTIPDDSEAKQLTYDLQLKDNNNEGDNTDKNYNGINYDETQDHTYQSCSNSPFEDDEYNKEVKMIVHYDDGFNEELDEIISDINVTPNTIIQSFILEPIRHAEDPETEDNIITGNNPIKFYDNSTTERIDDNGDIDFSFINTVDYVITEDC